MWAALIPIIATYGLPLAEKLVEKWMSGAPPTPADFAELRTLANQNATAQANAVIAQLGLSPTDPKAQQIIALVK